MKNLKKLYLDIHQTERYDYLLDLSEKTRIFFKALEIYDIRALMDPSSLDKLLAQKSFIDVEHFAITRDNPVNSVHSTASITNSEFSKFYQSRLMISLAEKHKVSLDILLQQLPRVKSLDIDTYSTVSQFIKGTFWTSLNLLCIDISLRDLIAF